MVEIEYELIHKNTKHRKGLYLKIREKTERGKKKRWNEYKYDQEVPIDIYINYYKQKNKKKGKTTIYKLKKAHSTYMKKEKPKKVDSAWKQHREYVRKLEKRGSLNKNIAHGITQVKINPNNMTQEKVISAYKKLLGPLVMDKELLNVIIQNVGKFKHRFRHDTRITGRTETGQTKILATVRDIGHRTINQYLVDYIQSGLCKTRKKVDSGWKLEAVNKLGLTKELIEHYANGRIGTVEATITFMRGKGR